MEDNVLSKNRPMTEEDLKFVSYAMAADLSCLIHWNRSDPNYHLNKPVYPHEEDGCDHEYWLKVAKSICYIGKPLKITDEYGVVRMSLGSDSLV